MNCEIEEITDLRTKRKWYERFSKAYSGNSRPFLPHLLKEKSRYFVAKNQNTDLGYIHINDKSYFFADFTDQPVWNISEAYVKPCFRSQGVLRRLISHVVDKNNVEMLHIELFRYAENEAYYESLGFNWINMADDLCMAWVFHDRFQPIIAERNRFFDEAALVETEGH